MRARFSEVEISCVGASKIFFITLSHFWACTFDVLMSLQLESNYQISQTVKTVFKSSAVQFCSSVVQRTNNL